MLSAGVVSESLNSVESLVAATSKRVGETSEATTTIDDIEVIKKFKVQVKDEPFCDLSPASKQFQMMADETSGNAKNQNAKNQTTVNNNNNTNVKNNTKTNAGCINSVGVSGSSVESGPNSANATRLNSTSNANSPANLQSGADHSNTNSNSSTVSNNLSHVVDGENQQEDVLKNKIMEEEGKSSQIAASGSISLEKTAQNCGPSTTTIPSNCTGNGNKKGPYTQENISKVKDEASDLIGNLAIMKKEENCSPSMSPVGFGTIIPIDQSVSNLSEPSVTPIKMELITNNLEKSAPVIGLSSDEMVGCNASVASVLASDTCSNSTVSIGGSHGGLGLVPTSINVTPSNSNFNINNINNALGNCLEYVQQQNHIFVFSTQLANKGAESVLSGQFQTIIAYHCTQPATKSFLEDFLVKNPMKMNKMNRQNCHIPGHGDSNSGIHSWQNPNSNSNLNTAVVNSHSNQNTNPNLAKMLQPPHKVCGSAPKNLFTDHNEIKRGSFDPSPVEALVSENDLMCWEADNANVSTANRNIVSSQLSEAQSLKAVESIDTTLDSLVKSSNDINTDNIISLQGVKVPDENLTPQQRQHREEQLAKIKKMNQFLFPENEKSTDSALGISAMNTSNAQMRQMQVVQKSDHFPLQLGAEDILMPLPDVIGEIGGVIPCNNGLKNNITCSSTAADGSGNVSAGTGSTSVMNLNINNSMQCSSSSNNAPSSNCNLMTESPEILASFGNANSSIMNVGIATDKIDGIHTLSQMEWTKIQQQLFEERIKGSKVPCRSSAIPASGSTLCLNQQSQFNNASNGKVLLPNPNNSGGRNSAQGPPPPYHPTQRSASVPIATQSPNPSSPNNHSLPSPRTTGTLGLPSNSPNMEMPSTNLIAASTASSKNCYQTDSGSPSNRHRLTGTNLLNHHLNSSPTTPLSNISPKDMESFNQATNTGDLKCTRPSPHRTRSPGPVTHMIDPGSLETRFPTSSPGLNFNVHGHMQGNQCNTMNSYKGPNGNSHERSMQFNRRSDNMPLNPNNSNTRPAPNKISQNFDPISSLAQMSQQLTNSVAGVGSSANGINMIGSSDIIDHSGLIPNLESADVDHAGQAVNQSSSSHPTMMGQRMMNPKICAFNTNGGTNNVVRDGPSVVTGPGFHSMLPSAARMMVRNPPNFAPNFNPNIQVKASTPNTIQYMPVRSQSNNINNGTSSTNIRMPPSLEFLHRYANPQTAGGVVSTSVANDVGQMIIGGGSINLNSSNEEQQQNKLHTNSNGSSNGIAINFFQNCNQPSLDDEGVGGVPGLVGQSSIIRGVRPQTMRQLGGIVTPRMLVPPGGLSRQQGQFSANQEGLDCNDPTTIFNNSPGASSMFLTQQHQQTTQGKPQQPKQMPVSMLQPQIIGNVGIPGSSSGTNNPLSSISTTCSPSGAGVGVNFVGPSSNDLKYAQQYHSFQQQLYATNTRSQQQQHQLGVGVGNTMITMPSNLSPNPSFFPNK